MNINDLINKEKLRCDDIVSVSLLLSIGFLFIFSRLFWIMSLIIYPLSSMFLYGLFYIYKGLFKKDKTPTLRILKLILGIIYLTISSFMFLLIFSYPHVTLSYIVYFLSLPVFLIGIAAILKGSIVQVYSPFYRKLNIFIGFLSLIIIVLALYYAEAYFTLSLTSLLVLLTIHGILRSGLYLSEYGLSIRNLKNIKLVFYIMDNLQMINPEEHI